MTTAPTNEMLASENAALAADLENVQTELDVAELRIKELESSLAAIPSARDVREALAFAKDSMSSLRDALRDEPAVRGRAWIGHGIAINDAIERANKALTATVSQNYPGTVTLKIPHGYASAEAFANDCDFEIVHNLYVSPARDELQNIRAAFVEASDGGIITDTVWMPEKISKNETLLDYIDAALSNLDAAAPAIEHWRTVTAAPPLQAPAHSDTVREVWRSDMEAVKDKETIWVWVSDRGKYVDEYGFILAAYKEEGVFFSIDTYDEISNVRLWAPANKPAYPRDSNTPAAKAPAVSEADVKTRSRFEWKVVPSEWGYEYDRDQICIDRLTGRTVVRYDLGDPANYSSAYGGPSQDEYLERKGFNPRERIPLATDENTLKATSVVGAIRQQHAEAYAMSESDAASAILSLIQSAAQGGGTEGGEA